MAGIPFRQVTGVLHNDPVCWQEVDEWIDAAYVAHVMAHNCLGLMGNYYSGMLDIYDKVSRKPRVFRPGMNWNSRRLRYFNIQWLTC